VVDLTLVRHLFLLLHHRQSTDYRKASSLALISTPSQSETSGTPPLSTRLPQYLQFLEAFAQWETQGALDLKSSVVIQVGTYVSSVVLVYSEPASNPAVFAPFYSVPPLSTPVPPVNSTALALANLLQSFQPNVPMR
jgi:hypothetical protein